MGKCKKDVVQKTEEKKRKLNLFRIGNRSVAGPVIVVVNYKMHNLKNDRTTKNRHHNRRQRKKQNKSNHARGKRERIIFRARRQCVQLNVLVER